jgi:hypothetical protein
VPAHPEALWPVALKIVLLMIVLLVPWFSPSAPPGLRSVRRPPAPYNRPNAPPTGLARPGPGRGLHYSYRIASTGTSLEAFHEG